MIKTAPAPRETDREAEDMGMGLAIAGNIIEAHILLFDIRRYVMKPIP